MAILVICRESEKKEQIRKQARLQVQAELREEFAGRAPGGVQAQLREEFAGMRKQAVMIVTLC